MNIGAVETHGIVTSSPVASTTPRPQRDSFQMQQSSDGDAAGNGKEIKQMIEKMQDQIVNMNVSLQYSTYGDKGEKIAVTVVNKETGQVVREIPSKEIQNLYVKMNELAGIMFNREI
jgi:flagellar protein FlaG